MSPLLLKRLSDENLGRRLAAGEAAAFDELYRRYVHRLSAYGSHLLGDPAAGDDVAQSALLKAYGALRDGRVPEKIRPWLFRIAHNTAIDLVVRRREFPADDVPEGVARESDPRAGALVAALAALPERQRRVYVLRELHGMRIAETARELELTSTQVEQALFAARNRLAELLVFGDRLDCATVQRLAEGPLDLDERRALKTHLRSCPACRQVVGLRGRALGWLPTPSLEWLRGLLVGGAAPAAAKVGVVVATTTLAGAVPLFAQHVLPRAAHASRAHTYLAGSAFARAPVEAPQLLVLNPAAPAPVLAAHHVALAVHHDSTEPEHHGPSTAGSDGGSGGQERGEAGPTTTSPAVEPTHEESGAGGSGGSDGGSGSSDAGTAGSDAGKAGSDPGTVASAPATVGSDAGTGAPAGQVDGGSGGGSSSSTTSTDSTSSSDSTSSTDSTSSSDSSGSSGDGGGG